MTHTSYRRALAAIGIGLAACLAGAVPATARQDPGSRPTITLPYSQEVYENHYGSLVPPAPAGRIAIPQDLRVDDNGFEYVQLGAGLLAGLALAGAGAAVVSRRSHAHAAHAAAHPA